ncbi:MAG: carboxymuconolactone decarboxylase family protein [Candidatus Eremiobacteraeota bacterium]|nr:carboxymuconolactone decarboxylase family protein [Candidatus Eremiobacteraeota bacterium]
MSDYHEHSDLSLLPELEKLDGEGFAGFTALDKTVGRTNGAIPPKYRELIALGVALTTQCPYCLDVHSTNAKKAGATREELAETVHIAAALRAGAALTHGLLALKIYDRA